MATSKKKTSEQAPEAGLPDFEAVIARLAEIVEQLEQGDLSLERSVALFEEGIHLTQVGTGKLDEAEARVNLLLKEDGKLREAPFEPEGGGES